MVDDTDSTGTSDGTTEAGTTAAKAPRRRASAAAAKPKSAADHVSASTAVEVGDGPAPKAKRAPKAKGDAEKPAKAPKAKAAKGGTAAGAESSGPGSPFAVMFQAPDLPTVVPGSRGRGQGGGAPADESETSTAARRRTRRRSGEGPREGDDAPNTVVRVRQPRRQPEQITEPQRVKGSTRLEAKKQRRRDGRDAGRRRPVITEAEFLARRESVDRVMVVRSKYGRIQIGVLEDGVLVEHYVARAADASLIGNVYLGRVQNVLPSMEAAFVDIGRGRNAVLYSGEVDWEAAAAAAEGEAKNQPRRIELALKPGDKVLVQVTKDPICLLYTSPSPRDS